MVLKREKKILPLAFIKRGRQGRRGKRRKRRRKGGTKAYLLLQAQEKEKRRIAEGEEAVKSISR